MSKTGQKWHSAGWWASVSGIAAVIAIVVAVFVYVYPRDSDGAPPPVAEKTSETTATSTSSDAPTASTSTTTAPTSESLAPAVFERTNEAGPVAIADQYSLDLDSDDWVAQQGAQYGYDLLLNARRLSAAKHLAAVDGEPTYGDCVRTLYRPYYEEREISVGDVFCVKTDKGRYARIVVREMEVTPPSLMIDIGVWSELN